MLRQTTYIRVPKLQAIHYYEINVNAVLTITNSLISNRWVWFQTKNTTRFGIGLTPHTSGVNLDIIVHNNPREGLDGAEVLKMLSV